MREPAKTIPELAAELRIASLCLPSEGDWVRHGEMMLPKNVCSDTANLVEYMASEIERLEKEVATLDATRHWQLESQRQST